MSKANRAEFGRCLHGSRKSKVREHIYKVWLDILSKYDVDGMHFDYVRFASPDFDYSLLLLRHLGNGSSRNFQKLNIDACRNHSRQIRWPAAETYTDKFGDFQRQQVTSLVIESIGR